MSFFSAKLAVDEARLIAAIRAAELATSGEIRVVVARSQVIATVATAQGEFARLGMAKTAGRNGVLIFIAPASRTFAIVGDTGIHEKCGEIFWQELVTAMAGHFRSGDFTTGLTLGIARAGDLLSRHFPREPDDRNELPDTLEQTD